MDEHEEELRLDTEAAIDAFMKSPTITELDIYATNIVVSTTRKTYSVNEEVMNSLMAAGYLIYRGKFCPLMGALYRTMKKDKKN